MKLNESPDSFIGVDNKYVSYTRSDAVSFIAFKEGYLVYSTAGVEGATSNNSYYGHVALAEAWILKTKKESNIDLSEEEEAAWSFYEKHLKTIGTIGGDAKDLQRKFMSGKSSPWDYSASNLMLKGRLWRGTGVANLEMPEEEEEESYSAAPTEKVVSFWGSLGPADIKSSLGLITKMIKNLGENPEEFYFELGMDFYPYSSVSAGVKSKTDFDKEYRAGSSIYTYSDFENLRTTMHTGGPIKGKRAKETLCRIFTPEFIEENPELRGFLPSSDCTGITYQGAKQSGFDSIRPEIEKGLAPTRELLRRKYGGAEAKAQIKGFLQGSDKEPVLPTTFEPGQAAGMRGRYLGGLRARSQREIDAAWDDFMKLRKREQTHPENISFKEWFSFLETFFF